MGEETISEDLPRIKFHTIFNGEIDHQLQFFADQLLELGKLQSRLETLNVIPILNDGLVGGNCAMRIDNSGGAFFVSKSGKAPHAVLLPQDFVLVTDFDRSTWTATYRSAHKDIKPSSDAPLHAAALAQDSTHRYDWPQTPLVAVHGHALAEGPQLEAAKEAGLPISQKETLFSTPDDLAALEALFVSHRYPEHKCYIRRHHGFFILGETVADVEREFDEVVLPLLRGD